MINQLLAAATVGQPTPEVGMGATILLYLDRHAATITSVLNKGNRIYITTQDDNATCVSGGAHDGSARYEFSRNERGRIRHWVATSADGKWNQIRWNEQTRRWNRVGSTTGLRIGDRDEYRDPHI